MLIALSVRDFVLIDALDVDVHKGFTSITGETGAGKSILLEALRFVLGGKGEKRFIRTGADRAIVSASFWLPEGSEVRQELSERGLLDDGDDVLTLRRVLNADGPTRMFANDQVISADLAKMVGTELVEIHGQHDGSALLNTRLHGDLLDQYAGAGSILKRVGTAYDEMSAARARLAKLQAKVDSRDQEISQLRLLTEELEKLAPSEGEASRLALERIMLLNSQKLIECLSDADSVLSQSNALDSFGAASRHLERSFRLPELAEAPEDSPQIVTLKSAQEAVERALIEINEAQIAVETARTAFDHDPDALESVEQRLFSLRAAGRKYSIDPDALSDFLKESQERLAELEGFDLVLETAQSDLKSAEKQYLDVADKLSALRQSSGEQLGISVGKELAPLKLEHAKFRVQVSQLELDKAGPNGRDDVLFEVQTNPGATFGALNQIASGGELARFTLALRVCLASLHSASLLIFDEADQGVGGAVAAAVGERLGRLAETRQVMAITHSPQVASSGHHHWHIVKHVENADTTVSRMKELAGEVRREEIARMLSGSEITKEARAAADRLMTETV
ncbi:MAG: DNA repair protein RecN [Ponticaulis sp.]|nr:DNA repair protein RecN [Ponticaulis sp.]